MKLNPQPLVAIVVGSVREGRFGSQVASWVHKHVIDAGLDTDVIDLADLTFPPTMAPHPDVDDFARRIDAADAVIVITPEYNHSYPGPLKTAIDAIKEHWHAKPVAFVSYGGLSGGLRAVEALRVVFATMHTVTIQNTVSLHSPWGPANDPTVDYPDAAATEALRAQLRQLLWWADAVRSAKERAPYPA